MHSVYTSSASKLLRQPECIQQLLYGKFTPITLQLAPTDKCNLKCPFCSVAKRNGDELAFQKILYAVNALVQFGLKAVEITGGGEPTMYRQIQPLCNALLMEFRLEVGLITNGIKLAKCLSSDTLDKLTWIRVSLNSLDFVQALELPECQATLGFSYVVHEGTTAKVSERIRQHVKRYKPAFLRLAPNCLTTDTIRKSLEIIEFLNLDKLPNAFVQNRHCDPPERCWFGYLKPFLAPDGYFYRCSANPLLERRFNPAFRMGRWDKVEYTWLLPRPFTTTKCERNKCFFAEQNRLIEDILAEIPHPNFL